MGAKGERGGKGKRYPSSRGAQTGDVARGDGRGTQARVAVASDKQADGGPAPDVADDTAMVDATVEATDDTAMLAHREEIAELNKKLRAVEVRAEQEARQHELEV